MARLGATAALVAVLALPAGASAQTAIVAPALPAPPSNNGCAPGTQVPVTTAQQQNNGITPNVPNAQTSPVFCGTLQPGGTSALYGFQYPGNLDVFTFNLEVFPDDPVVLQNVGLKVFGPTVGKTYVTGGVQPKIVPNISGNLISPDEGAYVVQVSNFDHNTPISYQLWLVTSGPPSEVTSIP
jgi:hypothetical protein